MRPFKVLFILIIFLIPGNEVSAQWVNDPTANLMICDLAGAQSLPKIVSTPDGGTYISWFDSRSGQYCVYLQRLNPLGFKQWDPNGLLISANAQASSLVDYDLISDASGNAVLIFSDVRNGGDLNVFAYKISPSGSFLWGNNGVDLYPAIDYQPNGKVVQTEDGGFVFAWILASSPSKIALQKLSADGNKLWGTNPIILQGTTEGFNYPALVKSNNNSVLLLHTATTGNFPAQTVKLRAQKLNSSGVKQWGTDGIYIQNIGKIAAFQVPSVVSDGVNGAFMSWYDDRDNNNLQSGFVQRISADSLLYYPVNGAEVSLSPSRQRYSTVVSFDAASDENAYVFWMETEPNQNQNGIMGQKLSQSGARLWGDNAKVFKELSAPNTLSISNLKTKMGSDRAYVFYLESNGSGLSTKTQGFACNFNGEFVWPGSFVTLSNPTQEKLHLAVTSDVFKNCKLAWGDRRIDEGIYAQDINPSGQLGNPVTPVELISFNYEVLAGIVSLHWITATENNNYGFEIERRPAANETGWENIGFVNGSGTTSERINYDFNDIHVTSGTYFYRLKQIDFSGVYSYSNELEVTTGNTPEYSIQQNYPNPFNPSTLIKFTIPEDNFVSLKVFDCLGREVTTLVNEFRKSGVYEINFNGSSLSNGIYYYRFNAGSFSKVRSMALVK